MNENSVITIIRRIKTCRASSGAIETLPPVTHVAFGDKGVDEVGKPLVPSEGDTKLRHEVARYQIGGVVYPEDTTARYSVTIPKDDLTGLFISEAALVDSEGDFVAIKTMYAKQKDEGTAFTFEFDDQF